jgi:hypothetical protein
LAIVALNGTQVPSDIGIWPCGQQVPVPVSPPDGQHVPPSKQMFGPGQKPFAAGAPPCKHTQLPFAPGIWNGGQVEAVGAGDELGWQVPFWSVSPAGQGANTRHPLSGGGAGTVPGGQGVLLAVPIPTTTQKKARAEAKAAVAEIRRVAQQTADRAE